MEGGVLQIVSNRELDELEQKELSVREEAEQDLDSAVVNNLAAHVRRQYQNFRWHRNKYSLVQRFLDNLRAYNGNYSPNKLKEIKQFGGSEVFAQMTAVKCRGATALLRDIFLSTDRSWSLHPTPDPTLPEGSAAAMEKLMAAEVATMMNAGQQPDTAALEERAKQLMDTAYNAMQRKAEKEARKAEAKLDDKLVEGGFYKAVNEFLMDLCIFPYACIKGPEFKRKPDIKWVDGELQSVNQVKMYWRRVSPFDLYFTPGASSAAEADVIERQKLARKDFSALLGVEGYREDAIRAVLQDYERGLSDWLDEGESERATEENREDPYQNDSELIDTLEFHGAVKGAWLEEFGFEDIDDPDKDYHVVAWVVGRHVIKVQKNPNPNTRHPYYTTAFEKVPGSIYGNSLPEILRDVQDVSNAAFRSLVNNMSIASGPQVVVNEERLSPTTDPDSLYPWKRWRTVSDPLQNDTSRPIDFFQPNSNANELLGVYRSMMEMADEVSAIPRYVTGGAQSTGGAASTASGLSMLMNNASKVLMNVAAAIDDDIIEPILQDTFILTMLTDKSGFLRGDEKIVVKGVAVAQAKETDRMRQLEFHQLTTNEFDIQIMGPERRARVLGAIAKNIGLPYDEVVPDDEEVQRKMQEAQQAQQQAAQRASMQEKPGGQTRPGESVEGMQQTRPMR